jgi:hypothetical protein
VSGGNASFTLTDPSLSSIDLPKIMKLRLDDLSVDSFSADMDKSASVPDTYYCWETNEFHTCQGWTCDVCTSPDPCFNP